MEEQHGGHMRRAMKLGVTVGWELGRVAVALTGLVGALGLVVLIPVWCFDMLTLGSMRPPVVAWLRDVVMLEYSITQVWTALPLHWPALWDHIVFGWMAMGVMAVAGVGVGLLLLPLVLLCAHDTEKR